MEKNKKYLIVCDLDGTLLNNNKEIPVSTVNYFKKLNQEGHIIVLASGRPTNNILFFYKMIGLKTPAIAFNGLHTRFANRKDDIKFFFNKKNIIQILKTLEKKIKLKNIFFSTEDCIYAVNDRDTPRFWKSNMKNLFCPVDEILKNDVMNFVIELEDKVNDKKKIEELLKHFKQNKICFWVGKYDGFVEIYDTVCNKYKAIMNIAKKLNINEENILAFGNDLNDIEFLKNLKYAYAMKNSSDYIKKHSHLTTKFDNDNLGVEKELNIILANSK
ncbi:MAG: HAD family hydrolase [Bacilli bacterium]|nr:HAD family hydrolase [Bacilli bacterium]